jgi:hypothetical protein
VHRCKGCRCTVVGRPQTAGGHGSIEDVAASYAYPKCSQLGQRDPVGSQKQPRRPAGFQQAAVYPKYHKGKKDMDNHSIHTLRCINMMKLPRNLLAMIALAVAVGAPLTPARAHVQSAGARSNENNILAIKFGESWEETKERRQARRPSSCPAKNSRAACETQSRCKWQKGTPLHRGEGYCYPAK